MRGRGVVAGVVAVVAGLALAACGGGAASTAPAAGGEGTPTLTLYNAQHEDLMKLMVDDFTRRTGIAVQMRNGDDSELANQIVQEGSASPADVFVTENSPAMTLVGSKGLFAPVDAPALAQVPAGFAPPGKDWVGFAARSTVFAYDTRALAPATLPASLLDLAQPQWKGKIGISAGGADFQAIVSAVLALKGEAATATWLAGLKQNAKLYQGNSTVMKAVNAGEIQGGVIYHYYWFKDQAESGANSKNVQLHYFGKQDPGAFVSVSGAGVLRSSKNAAAAQQFLAYLNGADGQKVLADSSALEYSVNPQVPANPKLKPLADLEAPTVDLAQLNGPKVVDLMTRAGLL
jgi:iron(III) transport system substrate-binding protein